MRPVSVVARLGSLVLESCSFPRKCAATSSLRRDFSKSVCTDADGSPELRRARNNECVLRNHLCSSVHAAHALALNVKTEAVRWACPSVKVDLSRLNLQISLKGPGSSSTREALDTMIRAFIANRTATYRVTFRICWTHFVALPEKLMTTCLRRAARTPPLLADRAVGNMASRTKPQSAVVAGPTTI